VNSNISPDLIAPCGMNCAICSAYLSFVNNSPFVKCKGCRPRNKQCAFLKKKCRDGRKLLTGAVTFCYECRCYPCDRLERLDKRYRAQYRMSMIENLDRIKRKGLAAFIRSQYRKYRCPKCRGLRSVHSGKCFKCDTVKGLKT
jgi:hypothetical protein